MATKPVAVPGMTFQFSPASVSGVVQVLTPPSMKLTAGGKGVYLGPVSVLITNIRQADKGSVVPGIYQGTFRPTAKKLLAPGKAALREGDEIAGCSDMGMAMKPGPNGVPVPSPISFRIKIKNPGQKKLVCE
ncbi:hypothetical protein [Vibrio quintilis]|uniref:Uncharacterized protein n=1 Tax=Vibrio quintilis TaxID=1117707 RepID=A0A1M7YUX9_9VIBR|nr:hypothetical protein [Vibrio quintilis]SHO56469.1 hypothetical protein VQ7734_02238 [Vibrio quintilis]